MSQLLCKENSKDGQRASWSKGHLQGWAIHNREALMMQSTAAFGETWGSQQQIFNRTDANHIDRKLNQTPNEITASLGSNSKCLHKTQRVRQVFATWFARCPAFIGGTGGVWSFFFSHLQNIRKRENKTQMELERSNKRPFPQPRAGPKSRVSLAQQCPAEERAVGTVLCTFCKNISKWEKRKKKGSFLHSAV